jgi:serine/threonine protein kinase
LKPEQLIGTTIGRYRLEALIGTGGVAAVYEATDSVTERRLALKVLFPPPGAGPELGERFRREARTVARLDHPGILPVFDVGEAGGHLFIAMKRAEGPSLQALLEARGRFDEATAAEVAAQVAEALDYAHRQGVIHRDVKPSNILMDGGSPVLTDFGVARALDDPALTATGLTVGTPAYMAPEQASDRPDLDGRADLYALGVVLYQMVTGRTPFWGSTPQVMHAHVYEPPPPPSSVAPVSPAMEAVILRALAKNPADRYPTGAALAADLRALTAPTRTRQLVSPTARPQPIRALRWGLAALLAAGLLGGGLWLAAGRPGSRAAPTPSPTRDIAVVAVPDRPTPAAPSPTPSPSPSPTPVPPSATPRAQPPVGDAQPPTGTLTPSPSPAATPTQAPSAQPPIGTASPTRPPKLPTPTPLPPTPTPCPQPVAAAFAAWPASYPDLAAQVGCPRGQALQIAAAWESFERGQMLWRGDLHQIYVLRQAGTWAVFDDLWRDGDIQWDAAIVPPGGFMQPVRGFGLVWRQQPGVRDDLGWATASEATFDAAFQPFQRALLIADRAQARLWALLSDGTWLAGP